MGDAPRGVHRAAFKLAFGAAQICIFVCHALGFAGPVVILKPGEAQKPEIARYLRTLVHTQPNPVPYEFEVSDGAQVGFYAPIRKFLNGAGTGLPLHRPCTSPDCNIHENHANRLRAYAYMSCYSHRAIIEDALQTGLKACHRVHIPETFAEDLPPGVFNQQTQTTLEGLVGLFTRTYIDLPWPETLWGSQEMSRLRHIIIKLRANELRNEIQAAQSKYLNTRSILQSCAPEALPIANWFENELQRGRQYVDRLESEGMQIAREDLKRLEQTGKRRATLPYPSLTDEDRRFLGLWIGALNWRLRGGGPIKASGSQTARRHFVHMAFGTLGRMAGGRVGQAAGEDFYPPLIYRGWSDFYDMGHNHDNPYYDLVRMTDRGLYQIAGAAQRLRGYTTEILRGAGMQMGTCYWYSSRLLLNSNLHTQPAAPYHPYIDGYTAWGEVCTGAALGWGLVDTLLKGY